MLMRLFNFAVLMSFLILGISFSEQVSAEGSGLLPSIAKGKGDKCVLPTDYMRRNHMDLLDHQRDETVLDGIRTKQFSLKQCVSCHAVKGDDGRAITVKNPKHFCASCHNYAAVNIDCFDCHASRPGENAQLGGVKSKSVAHDVAVLKSYLQTNLKGREK